MYQTRYKEGEKTLRFVAPGTKVVLTANVNVSCGLTNGSPGVVEGVVYEDGHLPPRDTSTQSDIGEIYGIAKPRLE